MTLAFTAPRTAFPAALARRRWCAARLSHASQGPPVTPGRLAQVTRTSGADVANPSLAAWWKRQQDSSSRRRPDSEQLKRLSAELEDCSDRLLPRERHVADKNEFLRRLQHHLNDIIDGADVKPFGSVVNGFWTSAVS
eukprot:gnl/TRDRNA2_/TRDRNA2_159633_c2_seq1.p1 gnl/TRDRNA2_/TRDRNA2_159633_c2~~gnl/TRDRNA2_/TRDRNA2_159633_c2_seq1.p1  ORF type:complete len:138 (-),score=17.45 gnl/TRDRNA2_/TRDRNA2_159633_c2_seq1:13-426(-)